MEPNLRIIGILLMLLSLVHVIFPRHFKWKTELQSLSIMNRQMMYVHSFFIAFVVLLMGILCFFCTDDLIHSKLGRNISLGLSVFWGMRLFFQLFIYSPKLWKGKAFETFTHIIFTLFWAYMTVLFLMNYLQNQ
jgi:hypothetical protein